MNMTRRAFAGTGSAAIALLLAACGNDESATATTDEQAKEQTDSTTISTSLTFDSAAWSYNADDDVYYQIGVPYCETPADESYETLAIFVPGAYFEVTDNGDGTYTCERSDSGAVGSYTAATAPIVMPVNTPGYSAQAALTEYSSQSTYTGAGIVYVHAGCRGRDHGAPAGVCDLNADGAWVSYDEATGTATITSVADFCVALKQASKSLGAFDQLDRGQGENTLFGTGGEAGHFDAAFAQVLDDLGSSYAADYADDLAKTDDEGVDVQTRVDMYTPLYYLLASQAGCGTSVPARHWRIRTGINQGDTALTCEMNLALAAQANPDVETVDFATVWGQGHTQAERTGSATDNFIAWVGECMA